MYEDEELTKELAVVDANIINGTVTFEDIPFSTIYIKETNAPKNYLLSNEMIALEVSNALEGVGETHYITYGNSKSVRTNGILDIRNLWILTILTFGSICALGYYKKKRV